MAKQANLFEYFKASTVKKRYGRTVHGGAKTKGHRKLERPLSTKKWIHLVLKSDKARGEFSFLTPKNKIFIGRLVQAKARRFGVRVADQANVGNHLHLKIKISSRENFQKFLISITAQIARFVTGARRGKSFGKFWQGLAYTRVLSTEKENLILGGYFMANREEAVAGKQGRDVFLASFYDWIYQERRRTKFLPAYRDG